jgi:hypothetical protein
VRFSQRAILRAQAAYYVATGVWPLLSVRAFEAVTGKKTDRWLVQTVGVLVVCIGASLALESRRERPSTAIRTLAVTSALGLAAIECVHAFRRRISPVYLADAALEIAIATALCGTPE